MEKTIHSSQYAVFLRVLRDARLRANLTQVELAERIGENQTFISKCERGERRIDMVELRAFCDALGLTLATFVRRFERAIVASPDTFQRKNQRER